MIDEPDILTYGTAPCNVVQDNVNHPPHYISGKGIEAIDVIEAFTEGLNGIAAADTANVLKYMMRWPHKNGLEDLKKARWYLDHLISRIELENEMKENRK